MTHTDRFFAPLQLSFLFASFHSSVSYSILPSRIPFRLQLEDKLFGYEPNVERAISHYTVCKQALGAFGGRCHITPTGHVLAMAPTSFYQESRFAIDLLKDYLWTDDIVLVDAVQIFTSENETFRCFLSNQQSKRGYAVRIEKTSVWLLVSDCKGLLKCNDCISIINRKEFFEIQSGFMNMVRFQHKRKYAP